MKKFPSECFCNILLLDVTKYTVQGKTHGILAMYHKKIL